MSPISPQPPLRFDGRIALITGAGRGIGRAYALELASRGAKVLVNDLGIAPDGTGPSDSTAAEQVADEIRAAGGEALADAQSIATATGAGAVVDHAMSTWGRLDIVIHNAGVVRRSPISDMRDTTLTDVLDVSLLGAFHLARAAWRHLVDSGAGRIVLTASGAGLFGAPCSSNYAAAKMGTIGLALSLAQEGATEHVHVNVVVPIAQTRLATTLPADVIDRLDPRQVAPVVAWLCHPQCQINGEMYSAAGGKVNRIAIGITPGVQLDNASIEEVSEAFAEVRSLDGAHVIGSSQEALELRLPAR